MKTIRNLLVFCFISVLCGSAVPKFNTASFSAEEPAHNEVIFFEHTNYGGNYFKWYYDRDAAYLTSYNMGSTQKSWNDQISSVKVGKNVCVTAWEHVNFKGVKIELKANGSTQKNYSSMPSGWNDKVSSLKIRMWNMCSKE